MPLVKRFDIKKSVNENFTQPINQMKDAYRTGKQRENDLKKAKTTKEKMKVQTKKY